MTRSSRSSCQSFSKSLTLALTVVGLAAGLGTTGSGCAGAGDIDRTQPDKLQKSLFRNADGTPKKFYYRWTLVGVPPTNGWAFEGLQSEMDKIYFDITEQQLIGYRAYDYAAGSQNEITGGANNKDAPVISFKISSHFDVKREYNPGTGEQTNVISEDSKDRPWNEREYIRVDWATDKLSNPLMSMDLAPFTGGTNDVKEGDITNPDRPIYTPDYIDVTTRTQATPDLAACMKLFSKWDDAGPWGCGPADLTIRHSLMAVKPTEYEPLEYPDRIPLLDANGKQIKVVWTGNGVFPCDSATLSQTAGVYTGADCSGASADQFSKFGFFRTVRQTYDPRLGAVEAGRKYYANRWNIWDKTILRAPDGTVLLDDQGNPKRIAPEQRETRVVPFYTNVEFPDDPMLFDSAKQVVGEWNEAMKRTVAGLQMTATGGGMAAESAVITRAKTLPDVLVLRQNSCNVTGVKAHLGAHADLAADLERATGIEAAGITKANLVAACSGMEALTQDLADDNAKKFAWQRNGDLRYSFVFWIDRPQGSDSSPLGYGPSSADPETGEIVSATLYEYGAALNLHTQMAADTVELLNNSLTTDDLLSGKRISDILKETADSRRRRDALVVTPEAKSFAGSLASSGGVPGATGGSAAGRPRLVRIDPLAADLKLNAIKGTPIETAMMTEDILAAFVPGYIPGRTQIADIDPALLERASPSNWLSQRARDARRDRFQTLAKNSCVFTAEYADDAILGTAMRLAHLSGEELFRTLRKEIFRGLAGHEMGHTMGLRHNFAGSTDALNYGKSYWDIKASGMTDEQKSNAGLEEHMYSTVMDYAARFNSDNQGLGMYDYAAIRFGYGQLVDTMPGATISGNQLANSIFFGDYTKIPQMVGDVTQVNNNGIMRYSDVVTSLRDGYRSVIANTGGGFIAYPERPYKFCSDEFEGNLDCKVWDMGANQTEIVNNTIDVFKNYYIFHAYRRGRVTWNIDRYLDRVLDRYFIRYNEAFQFFYFFGDAFKEDYLGEDLLRASMLALNALGEVLETPEPGHHCATDYSPDVLVRASGAGVQTCRNDAPQMALSVPDAKPYYISFGEEYYYSIERAGSLYEKLAALIALTSTQSRFFRVDSFADQDRFSINYYRLFKDQMLNLLSGITRNDPTVYGGYVSAGKYVPMPVVDPAIYGKASFDMPEYMKPGAKRVDTPVNKTIRYYALGLSLAQLSSTWDSTLDFSNYANVSIKGSNDDVEFAPGTVIDEFVHPQSHQVYRAARAGGSSRGIGVELIQELNLISGKEGVAGTLPKKYGLDQYTQLPYPDWFTAKAALETARASGNQTAYQRAFEAFTIVDSIFSYRVDLLNDVRIFRNAFSL
jgi:hypothetical protein